MLHTKDKAALQIAVVDAKRLELLRNMSKVYEEEEKSSWKMLSRCGKGAKIGQPFLDPYFEGRGIWKKDLEEVVQ
ncbi:hypothetical protein ONS95_000967 [Cadophora gregata]|uniref:uncharacterized protein n=1 Tax=Cadophora gregata TaxID=51156 RepID=UPI0026DA6F28|nr:uncharacterized protein ONS95_000967 [Cadophora gregata]KAK0102834.1 hypothetical protein ONS96_005466 [Cadophora gregata f. sp. sojae]KAK0129027.1 hypothetical protein ONS95_000967 [Cadophora gregata]